MANYEVDTIETSGLEQNLYDVANNLGTMAETVNNVTDYVSLVNEKVGDVSKDVNSLNEKLDLFMERVEGTSVVTNAKQSMMLSNQELDRKYSHYGEVRRHILGILESIDMGVINKETLTRVSEEIVIKTPNYWLGKALFALVCWLNNNQELANKSLNEAINLDDEKTSLLFFLIYLRIKRIKPALIWFNRYLEMQDPVHLDNVIINILNSLITGVYGLDAKKTYINNMIKWESELNSHSGIKDKEIVRWKDFINKKKEEIVVNESLFPYLLENDSWPVIKENIKLSFLYGSLCNYFDEIFSAKEEVIPNYKIQVDKMINDLVSNYDREESQIQNEILKNKIIIEENGNLDNAYKRFDEEKTVLQETKDYYSYLTDIAMYPDRYDIYHTTRKFAISKQKQFIIDALKSDYTHTDTPDIKIKIADWEGIVRNGNNEKELRQSISSYIDSISHDDVYASKYLNTKTIFGVILLIIGIIAGYMINNIIFVVSLVGIIIFGIECLNVYKSREVKLKKVNDIKKNAYIQLGNIISEIVDYQDFVNKGKNDYNRLIAYLNNLNYQNFIMSNTDSNYRKINVGDNNG